MEYSKTGRWHSATTSRIIWMLSASSCRRWLSVLTTPQVIMIVPFSIGIGQRHPLCSINTRFGIYI